MSDSGGRDETKIIYYYDEETTPYLIKLNKSPDAVTLSDFKAALNKCGYRYYFKSVDDELGVVKEEITDDAAHLPAFNGRVVSWLAAADGTALADENNDRVVSPAHVPTGALPSHTRRGYHHATSLASSEIESTTFMESEDDRCSTMTETTATASMRYGGPRRHRRKHHRRPLASRASSMSSITDSNMSLDIITVTLHLDSVNFLGISIVGQSNDNGGDGGIYVGSVMKGGAVALDGRVEPGDMLLEVNNVTLDDKSNDQAVRVLREAVQKPGAITLVVAKCFNPQPRGYVSMPQHEPVRPIDPGAWVEHTEAMRRPPHQSQHLPSMTNMTATTQSVSAVDEGVTSASYPLNVHTDMVTVVRAMAQEGSGLNICERSWLKIAIHNAFIGSELVDWLWNSVEGFTEKKDAKKYAGQLLKQGYIRHVTNKQSFSEQCYYVFGDIVQDISQLNIQDLDSVSEADRDTLGPLPPPNWHQSGYFYHQAMSASYASIPAGSTELASFCAPSLHQSGGSTASGGSGGSGGKQPQQYQYGGGQPVQFVAAPVQVPVGVTKKSASSSTSSGSDTETGSLIHRSSRQRHDQPPSYRDTEMFAATDGPASRGSFRLAMNNTGELTVTPGQLA